MEKVQAGMLSDTANLIKSISDTLFKAIDALVSGGAAIDNVEKIDGGFSAAVVIDGEKAKLLAVKVDGKAGYFDVVIKHKSGKTDNLGELSERDLKKYLEDNVDSVSSTANSAHKLQITLQKIVSSDTIDVRLTAINSNYDVKASMDDLDLLLSDDEFIDKLSEDPMSFEITDEDDMFDVTSIDGVDTSNSIQQMLGSAILLWANMKELMWNTYGVDMEEAQCRIHSYLYTIESEIDMLAGLCVELNQKAPNPLDVATDYNHTSAKIGYSKDIAYMYLYDEIMTYVSVLDMFYVNFSHDVQAELDRMIRCWKREADHIGRSTINPMLSISSD